MSLLLLTTYKNNMDNRFHLYSKLIFKHAKSLIDVHMYYYCKENLRIVYELKNIKFVILITEHSQFLPIDEEEEEVIATIKKNICSNVYRVCQTNVYYENENILFYFRPCGELENTVLLKWFTDERYFKKKSRTKNINILFNNRKKFVYKKIIQNDITNIIIDNVIGKSKDKILSSSVNKVSIYLDGDDGIEYKKKIIASSYDSRLEQYQKIHIFFVTRIDEDESLLFDLAMANIVIVAPYDYVDRDICKLLDIIEFDPLIIDINIGDIITKSKKEYYNTRDKLIGLGYSSNEVLNLMFKKIFGDMKHRAGFNDNIDEVNDEDNMNNIDSTDNTDAGKNKHNKNRKLLQSHILKI